MNQTTEATMRALSEEFLAALKEEGVLFPLTEMVRSDSSLCLELRGDSINIYYRGGSLMKVSALKRPDAYSIEFDCKYFNDTNRTDLPDKCIENENDVRQWISALPCLKRAMDNYWVNKKGNDEREYQQLILRDNNFGSIAKSTDYYICDIEYQTKRDSSFDMIAVHWPSTPHERGKTDDRRLAFIEVKHGDKALGRKSGLHDHIEKINQYAGDSSKMDGLKKDMVKVFNQKKELGLMDCKKELTEFSNKKPMLILALVNHDPEKPKLCKFLNKLPDSPHVELKIATASFLGCGLYDQGIHRIDEACDRFRDYIYFRQQRRKAS